MLIGICEIEIYIYDSASLKSKRSTLKSLIERLKSRFNISIAEVGAYDIWDKGLIGFAIVGNDTRYINKNIDKILDFIDRDYRIEIINSKIEII